MDGDNEREGNNARRQRETQLTQLTPDGQRFLSLIRGKSKYPSFIEDEINRVVNEAARKYLGEIKDAVEDLAFGDYDGEGWEDLKERGFDSDWHDEEKVEAAIRIFPEVLSELDDGCFPILHRAIRSRSDICNLKAIPLIPFLSELGTELGQFREEERGGLLRTCDDGTNVLYNISCTNIKPGSKQDREEVEDCCLDVIKRLRGKSLFVKEDIQEFNIFNGLFTVDNGYFAYKRFEYLVEWDPIPLAMPCNPENGTWLPIHFSTEEEFIDEQFIPVLEAGMKYFPEKLGFVFCEGTQTLEGEDSGDEPDVVSGTPFQLACERFGREKVAELVEDCIDGCFAAATIRTESLLLSIAADDSFHLDGLYTLLRKDPAAVSRLLQNNNNEGETGNNDSDNNRDDDAVTVGGTGTRGATTAVSTTASNNDDDDDNNSAAGIEPRPSPKNSGKRKRKRTNR